MIIIIINNNHSVAHQQALAIFPWRLIVSIAKSVTDYFHLLFCRFSKVFQCFMKNRITTLKYRNISFSARAGSKLGMEVNLHSCPVPEVRAESAPIDISPS